MNTDGKMKSRFATAAVPRALELNQLRVSRRLSSCFTVAARFPFLRTIHILFPERTRADSLLQSPFLPTVSLTVSQKWFDFVSPPVRKFPNETVLGDRCVSLARRSRRIINFVGAN